MPNKTRQNYVPARVVSETLTDGSKVHNVEVMIGGKCVLIIAGNDAHAAARIARVIIEDSSWVSTCKA